MKGLFLVTILVCLRCNLEAQKQSDISAGKIVITIRSTSEYYKERLPNSPHTDSIEFESAAIDYVGISPQWRKEKFKIDGDYIKIELETDKLLLVRSAVFGHSDVLLVQPGDNISITDDNGKIRYMGKGALSFELQNKIISYQKKLIKPGSYIKDYSKVNFFKWKKYLDDQLNFAIPLIESYKTRISFYLYQWLKSHVINNMESVRLIAFNALLRSWLNGSQKLSKFDLENILDSTLNNQWAKWLRSQPDYINFNSSVSYLYQYNLLESNRKSGFGLLQDTSENAEKRILCYYGVFSQNYNGLLRERLLEYFIYRCISDLGTNHPLITNILNDYYAEKRFPEYKEWMKEYVAQENRFRTRQYAPDFSLISVDGKTMTKKDLNNKIALIIFWYSECRPCLEMDPILHRLK